MQSADIESMRQVADCAKGWQHWLPFAALTVKRDVVPPNRPMATRILEQAFVAILAGGGSAYGVNSAVQIRQEEQIKNQAALQAIQIAAIKEQMRDSEIRLTAQIVELRARQLK